jgi:hypothetical protein
MHNYTPLVISRKDKNTDKQLTLVSQRKLALTATKTLLSHPKTCINRDEYTSCNIKSLEQLQNLKGLVLYLGLELAIHIIKSQIHLVRHSLLNVSFQNPWTPACLPRKRT